MSRYTTEELQAMCKSYLWRQRQGDDTCIFFIQFLSVNTGLSIQQCEAMIHKMARTGSWH